MGDGFQYMDIILLAMVAAFIALRLRSVLGRRTGDERPQAEQAGYPSQVKAPAIAVPSEAEAFDQSLDRSAVHVAPDSPAYQGLRKIHDKDRSFDINIFVAGAKAAYGMILEAFWTGDTGALKPLVNDDVQGHFAQAIEVRQKAGLTVANKLVAIDRLTIEDVALDANIARITVKYVSDIILVTKDSENRVVEGDVSDAVPVTDIWTFERDLRRTDPNWILVSTRSGQ